MTDVFNLIKNHKQINKELLEVHDVDRDGNCLYRTLSLYFTNDQSHYKFFREQIYIAAKNNFKELQEFFINEENDQILTNKKLDGYIDKIKDDYFFAGNIEIYIATKVFNLNIAIYEQNNLNEDYKHYSLFTPQTTTKEFILILKKGGIITY